MKNIDDLREELKGHPKRWLVTGVAGFIGSSLLEELLRLDQSVIGLDNFSTGYRENLEDVRQTVGNPQWSRFVLLEGDIRNLEDCRRACNGVDYVLHQAALGSVPRSIDDPIETNRCNVDGFLNMLVASKAERVKRFVYAASSAVYGDGPGIPKTEDRIGRPLSPYAVTKVVNELYADVFARLYEIECIGLRYFNVFGKRQDPHGAYAAVIPKWTGILINGGDPLLHGDGEMSRDFCYIRNVIGANLQAATVENEAALNNVYNIACGNRTSLNQLFGMIQQEVAKYKPDAVKRKPLYGPFRQGDIRHSLADIRKAKDLLGYDPKFDVSTGIAETVRWFALKQSVGSSA